MKKNNLQIMLLVFILTLASLSVSAQSYKGFVEAGYGLSFGDDSEDLMTVSTTHGLQLNPKFFIGAGVAFEYGKDSKKNAVPFFLDGRFNLFNKPFTPFVDLKFGYSFFQSAGYFINPTIGYRIGLGNKSALNVGVGYTHQHNTDEYIPIADSFDYWLDDHYYGGFHPTRHYVILSNNICLKIGYEF